MIKDTARKGKASRSVRSQCSILPLGLRNFSKYNKEKKNLTPGGKVKLPKGETCLYKRKTFQLSSVLYDCFHLKI